MDNNTPMYTQVIINLPLKDHTYRVNHISDAMSRSDITSMSEQEAIRQFGERCLSLASVTTRSVQSHLSPNAWEVQRDVIILSPTQFNHGDLNYKYLTPHPMIWESLKQLWHAITLKFRRT